MINWLIDAQQGVWAIMSEQHQQIGSPRKTLPHRDKITSDGTIITRCSVCKLYLDWTHYWINKRTGRPASQCRSCNSACAMAGYVYADPAETHRKKLASGVRQRHTMLKRQPCELGMVIDAICAEHGTTLAQLARLAFSHVGTISKIRSGDRRPSRPFLGDLVAAWSFLTDDERARLYLSAGFGLDQAA